MSFEDELDARIERVVRRVLSESVAPQEQYLSTRGAAEVAGVAPGTIRRWIHEGKLPQRRAGRLVRVGRAELDRLLREGTRGSRLDRAVTPETLAERAFAARAARR